jgi:hypothetical protein
MKGVYNVYRTLFVQRYIKLSKIQTSSVGKVKSFLYIKGDGP